LGGLFPEWTVVVGLMLGATIGSFLNVVIYRMPRAISLSDPAKSFCPKCRHSLGPADLVPLFSWLLSGGKCRYCKSKVASRYFWVELLNGSIWAGLWWQTMVATWDPGRGIALMLAASALVAAIFIDFELYIIPDQINAFLLFVGFGYNLYLYSIGSPLATQWGGVPSSLAGAIVGTAILWGITLLGRVVFGKDAMGHGDIKLARGIGAILFPSLAVMSFALAVVLGAVLGLVQILPRLRKGESEAVAEVDDGEHYEPESIGSIFKCGIGYFLCFDVVGLFVPKFYKSYFGEDPYEPIQEEEGDEVETTMIPFGPYLALGAILAAVFEPQLFGGIQSYWQWATGGRENLEQLFIYPGQ
jgi:leader peptidase (prepilin peptidase)/N-methyltransferase